jgi:integrase
MARRALTASFVETVKSTVRRVEYWDERLTGFSLRVSENGVKSWTVFYRHQARLRRLTLGTYPTLSLADARERARRALRDASIGLDPAAAKQEARDAETFAELARLYLERHAKIKKRSWAEDERIVNSELIPAWGHRKAADITRKDVIAVLDRIVERGAGVMANRTRALISKIYNFAILDRGMIEHNPAYKVANPGEEHQRDRVLTQTEIRALWTALEKQTDPIAAVFKLALLTAQRRGEVLGMAWSELDLDAGWWTIPAERAKNKLAHRVPLSPQALAILGSRRERVAAEVSQVFPGPRHKPISNPQKWMVRVKAAAGVDFRFHDLRRTAASMMTGIGVERLIVSKILNHVERGITAVYDRHSYDSEKRAALLRWDRHLNEIVEDKTPSNMVVLASTP